ncbi:DUF3006 domain-containing protein [Clostridium sp. A1-XYC3]|uniref:DUF3006 domain-containing protein n=1 Tax=Clostridium tanneri TaxID=3037988 RepID=A0ABU4JXG7_9CLOT|nr:DUF3006 domain-containing protein [Clostridium sp. A1-XYC3]MDW8802801.1 DUF3006 domain-containing protein [Clostridium sp. A1-XYC3]
MIGIIDRFEGYFAIIELEDRSTISIERNKIPEEAKEGYVLNIDKTITINLEETKKRTKYISNLTDDMWK